MLTLTLITTNSIVQSQYTIPNILHFKTKFRVKFYFIIILFILLNYVFMCKK